VSIRPSKDKVPPARREPTEISLEEIDRLHRKSQPKPKRGGKLLCCLLVLGAVGGAGYWQWDVVGPHFNGMKAAIAATDFNFLAKDRDAVDSPEASGTSVASGEGAITTGEGTVASTTQTTQGEGNAASGTELEQSQQETEPDTLLNHRRYEVVPVDGLVPLNPNSIIKLQPDAQAAITKMITKAKIEGVQLGLISGYRTLEDQNYLYFDLKAERGQSAQARAEVSAPPGYSEHHTGYAVDFIDESKSDTHLSPSFASTDAFKWLEKNAPYFSFELSFPEGNEANISYEPWHWRYVGNQESLELFYKE